MKKILLMDTLSTIHVGNGALLENTIKICQKAYGECDFHIITMDTETNKARYTNLYNPMFGNFWFGLGRIGKIVWAIKHILFILMHILNESTIRFKSDRLAFTKNQKNSILAIQNCDIAISCGGEIISDTFFQALPFWLFTYWLAIKKGKKFILFPQSVGPLNFGWTRLIVRLALREATLLVGRDKDSYDTLLSLGLDKRKIILIPDVAIQQELGDFNIHSYFQSKEKKVIGITISKPPKREMGKDVDFISELGSQLKNLDPKVFKVLIFPSNFIKNGISPDYDICLQLKNYLFDKFEVEILQNRPYFPDEYTSLLSQLEIFISTRMHVAILATTYHVPTIAINTQHKIRGYMRNIHMEQFCVDYDDFHKFPRILQTCLDERDYISNSLKKHIGQIKMKHEEFIQILSHI